MEKTKLSIFCLTYNHVDFIEEAIQGFLNQKTNFKYNIFVFDDASTDGTSDILLKYQLIYSDKIKIYISPINTYNISERKNILRDLYLKYLTGEYIAWCEGDDVWIDINKLQLQVDYMDKHLDCAMTTHAFDVLDYSKNKKILRTFAAEDRYLTSEEIILQPKGNLATASLVMRREVFLRDEEFPECDVEDFPMQLYALCTGKIFYINKTMSLYRYMHDGSWCKENEDNIEKSIQHKLLFIEFLKKYNIYSKFNFSDLIWKKIIIYLYDIVLDLSKLQKLDAICFKQCLKRIKVNNNFFDEIAYVYEWMNGKYVFDEKMQDNFKQYEHICIMGAGKYSKYIEKVLNCNFVSYDGFIVSKKDEQIKEYNNKHVLWSINNYPYDKSKTLVIIGISQVCEREINRVLKENKFINVFSPLWFLKDNVYY